MKPYSEFLIRKTQLDGCSGFDPHFMPDCLFDFQVALTEWAVRKGRGALFADCGLGKTLMELVWARNVVEKENGKVLLLTPLAVGPQVLREAEKFAVTDDLAQSRDGEVRRSITVTNYEQLHRFNWQDFTGVVCDESSILKAFDGTRRREITAFLRKIPYRLLATATPSPNDFIELGTSSEAIGYLDYSDMLARFFKNEEKLSEAERRGRRTRDGLVLPKWLLKGHAEEPFWRWVCSWARALRKPSDLGFSDEHFTLPALTEVAHKVEARSLPAGKLLHVAAISFKEQLEERRRTIRERCERVAELAADREPCLAWCHLNDEGELLAKLIPDAVEVSGRDSDEAKEEKMLAFVDGKVRCLITKPKIGCWGLNFQHCAHEITFPSHSYEQYYQAVRRCWRFGQKRPVTIDIVVTEAERDVMGNLQRKQEAADRMFTKLVEHMAHELHINRVNEFTITEELPVWL